MADPVEDGIAAQKAKMRVEQPNGFSFRAGAEFLTVGDNHYKLNFPSITVTLEVDRLRRERQELCGELAVYSGLPGAKVVHGGTAVSIADFNLSSARARSERAKLLMLRSGTSQLDWLGMIEELCQKVLEADRHGTPGVDLRDVPRPGPDDNFRVHGLTLPRRHPAILFGDGGTAKSYTALYVLGTLSRLGYGVALFDWELDGADHRDRLERIFGEEMPEILYMKCEQPLHYECDRLSRAAREWNLEYAVYDSVAFACDGPPESAEIAGRYFRAVRQIGIGSLHIAHVNKSEDNEKKPFGSSFWHNGARSTWFCKAAEETPNGEELQIGFFNRKNNVGKIQAPVGFTVSFGPERTLFTRSEPGKISELADSMSLWQKMAFALRAGALLPEQLAEETDVDVKYVNRAVKRHPRSFVVIPGGKIGLLNR